MTNIALALHKYFESLLLCVKTLTRKQGNKADTTNEGSGGKKVKAQKECGADNMKRPKNRDYVKYLSKSLQGLLPGKFTNENLYLLDDVMEAIRCVEIVYGVGAGEEALVRKRLNERVLADKYVGKESESKGEKFAQYGECYRKCVLSFLFGYFVSSILVTLLELFLKLI